MLESTDLDTARLLAERRLQGIVLTDGSGNGER
jgi:hypothetical protein